MMRRIVAKWMLLAVGLLCGYGAASLYRDARLYNNIQKTMGSRVTSLRIPLSLVKGSKVEATFTAGLPGRHELVFDFDKAHRSDVVAPHPSDRGYSLGGNRDLKLAIKIIWSISSKSGEVGRGEYTITRAYLPEIYFGDVRLDTGKQYQVYLATQDVVPGTVALRPDLVIRAGGAESIAPYMLPAFYLVYAKVLAGLSLVSFTAFVILCIKKRGKS